MRSSRGHITSDVTAWAKGFPPQRGAIAPCVLLCCVHMRGNRCADAMAEAATRRLQEQALVSACTTEEMGNKGEAKSDQERHEEERTAIL